ncbi:hypothetical protein JHV675_51310 [Mycobacterium avium subsp. hominissuis]
MVLFGEATTVIGARMDANGNGVFCDFGWGGIEVYCVVDGVATMLYRVVDLFSAPAMNCQVSPGSGAENRSTTR